MSIYIFILLIAVILFVIRQRAANAKSEYTEELQLVVQRMRKQSEQLAKAREGARESKLECVQRENQLSSLRSQVKALSEQLSDVQGERDEARNALEANEAKIMELTSLLAKTEAKRVKLEADMSAASIRHLEVVSKLHTDRRQRMRAIKRLRIPERGLIGQHEAAPRPRDVPVFMNRSAPIAKSPSEASLRDLQPDLDVSDSDEELEHNDEHHATSVGQLKSTESKHSEQIEDVIQPNVTNEVTVSKAVDVPQPRLDRAVSDRMRRPSRPLQRNRFMVVRSASVDRELSLQRNPFIDFLNPSLDHSSSKGSIAQVLEGDAAVHSPGLFSRNIHRTESGASSTENRDE